VGKVITDEHLFGWIPWWSNQDNHSIRNIGMQITGQKV